MLGIPNLKKMAQWLAYGLAALLAISAAIKVAVDKWPHAPAAAVSSPSRGGMDSGGAGSR